MSKQSIPLIHTFDFHVVNRVSLESIFNEATESEWHTTLSTFSSDYPDAKAYLYLVEFTDDYSGVKCSQTHVYAGLNCENDILLSILSELDPNNKIIGDKNSYTISIRRAALSNKTLNNADTISKISSNIGGDIKRNNTLIRKALNGDIVALEELLILQQKHYSK